MSIRGVLRQAGRQVGRIVLSFYDAFFDALIISTPFFAPDEPDNENWMSISRKM